MKKNYEIKCKIENYKKTKDLVCLLKFTYSFEKQIDIYYKVPKGRLKLRIINNKEANLIFYERAETTAKRISRYTISGTKNFRELDEILKSQFKVMVTVNKTREIYTDKNIRIHLDTVKALGRFLEIEIIYEDLRITKIKLKQLISELGLNEKKFIKNSYSDLLIKKF